MNCKSCKENNRDDSKFCIACGSPLLENAGSRSQKRTDQTWIAKFCTNCGSRIGLDESQCSQCSSPQPFLPVWYKSRLKQLDMDQAEVISHLNRLRIASPFLLSFLIFVFYVSLLYALSFFGSDLAYLSNPNNVGIWIDFVALIMVGVGIFAFQWYRVAPFINLRTSFLDEQGMLFKQRIRKRSRLGVIAQIAPILFFIDLLAVGVVSNSSIVLFPSFLWSTSEGLIVLDLILVTAFILVLGCIEIGMLLRLLGSCPELLALKRLGVLFSIPVVNLSVPMWIFFAVPGMKKNIRKTFENYTSTLNANVASNLSYLKTSFVSGTINESEFVQKKRDLLHHVFDR